MGLVEWANDFQDTWNAGMSDVGEIFKMSGEYFEKGDAWNGIAHGIEGSFAGLGHFILSPVGGIRAVNNAVNDAPLVGDLVEYLGASEAETYVLNNEFLDISNGEGGHLIKDADGNYKKAYYTDVELKKNKDGSFDISKKEDSVVLDEQLTDENRSTFKSLSEFNGGIKTIGYVADVWSLGKASSVLKKGAQAGVEQAEKQVVKGMSKEAVEQAGKQITKEVGEEAAEQVGKQAIKATIKEAGEEVTEQAGKQVAKEAAEQVGKQIAKEAGEEAAEQTAKASTKAVIGQMGKNAAKATAKGISETFANLGGSIAKHGVKGAALRTLGKGVLGFAKVTGAGVAGTILTQHSRLGSDIKTGKGIESVVNYTKGFVGAEVDGVVDAVNGMKNSFFAALPECVRKYCISGYAGVSAAAKTLGKNKVVAYAEACIKKSVDSIGHLITGDTDYDTYGKNMNQISNEIMQNNIKESNGRSLKDIYVDTVASMDTLYDVNSAKRHLCKDDIMAERQEHNIDNMVYLGNNKADKPEAEDKGKDAKSNNRGSEYDDVQAQMSDGDQNVDKDDELSC